MAAAAPPDSPPAARIAKTFGNVIYEDWISQGKAIHKSPDDANAISWPVADVGPRLIAHVVTTSLPASVELKFFSAIDAQGQPTDDGRTEACRATPTSGSCSFTVVADQVVIKAGRLRRADRYLVIGVDWFVPVEQLKATPGAAASDALKYTFQLRPSSDGR